MLKLPHIFVKDGVVENTKEGHCSFLTVGIGKEHLLTCAFNLFNNIALN